VASIHEMTTADITELPTKRDLEALARFRFGLRAISASAKRRCADRLRLRHHSVVGLVNRAPSQDLVHRTTAPDDARAVRVVLSDQGEHPLDRLSALHRDELRRMDTVLSLPQWHPAE
jgi:hypothetical protein